MLAIRLPEELERRLADIARRTGRSMASHAQEALAAYVDDLEDLYHADKEVERVDEGQSTTYSLEEVMRDYEQKD